MKYLSQSFTLIFISLWLEQELRVKNWKVMEALSAAELRAKSNNGKNFDVSPHFTYLNLYSFLSKFRNDLFVFNILYMYN